MTLKFVIPGKRKRKKEGYLSKSFCRVNFIINITKRAFRK